MNVFNVFCISKCHGQCSMATVSAQFTGGDAKDGMSIMSRP